MKDLTYVLILAAFISLVLFIFFISYDWDIPLSLRLTKRQLKCLGRPVYYLRQTDFEKGTFRILKPGTYVFAENITFDPVNEAMEGYADLPQYVLGFFAALTVETDNVVIDLNGKCLKQSDRHCLHQRFYANIELASSPFPPRSGPANFGAVIATPSNIIVKNGILGLSSHHAIHGNGNRNVWLYNLRVRDFEIAGLALNGATNVIMEDLNIGPNSRQVPVNAKYSQIHFLLPFLKKQTTLELITSLRTMSGQVTSFSGTQILNILTDMLANPGKYEELANPSAVSDGNIYGIVLNKFGVAVNDIPLEFVESAKRTQNAFLRNINIHHLKSFPHEVPSFTTSKFDPSSYGGISLQIGPVGDVFRVETDADGFYQGGMLAAAQLWLSQHAAIGTIANSVIEWVKQDPPVSLDSFLKNTLNPPHLIGNHDSMAHSMKGNIGIFLCMTSDLKLVNVNIDGLINKALLSTIDSAKFAQLGGSSHGVLETVSKNTTYRHVRIKNIYSKFGSTCHWTNVGNYPLC
jgi:hypothetical protein